MAIGGSTNAIIHLAAIAGRRGIKISNARAERDLATTTPVLVDLKPVGEGYMEDFHAAGGVGAVLRELKPLLHLERSMSTARRWASGSAEPLDWVDRKVIRSFDESGLAGRRADRAAAATWRRTAPS